MRQTISEYMKSTNITKEELQRRLKSKELDYVVEDGIVYVKSDKPSTTTTMILSLYQKENHQLKLKIKELEAKIDKLINDKEQMLIAERERIEDIYISKDEQLKSILEVFNTKLLLSNEQKIHDVDIEQAAPASSLIELKRYLKFIGVDSQQRKEIKRRFEIGYGTDPRIIQKNGEFYVDLGRFDYTDFLTIS